MIMCVTSENPIRRNIKHHDNITLDRIWKKIRDLLKLSLSFQNFIIEQGEKDVWDASNSL